MVLGLVSRALTACALLLIAAPSSAAPPTLDGTRLTGTYRMLNGGALGGDMAIQLVGANKLRVYFDLYYSGYGGLSAASGFSSGEATLRGDVATYGSRDFPECKIGIDFEPGNRVVVTQTSGNFECGFGSHVIAEGTYEKVSARPPNFEFRDGSAVPPPTDPESLARRAEAARKSVIASREAIDAAGERLTALAARRTELQASITAQKLESTKRLRAGDSLMTRAAAAKPGATPPPAELFRAAKVEYEAARVAARAVVTATASLREVEDDLVQLVAVQNLAASDAKAAVTEVRTLTTPLTNQVRVELADARKAASAANLSASRARSAAGVYSLDAFQKQRDKSKQDDDLLAPELAAAATERASLEASLKPPPKTPPSPPKPGARR